MNVVNRKYVAFKCLECGIISVFPEAIAEGNVCIECKGHITPIGHARVYKKRTESTIDVEVNVDTNKIDEAIEKAKELAELLDYISPHKK